jgi:hypothetical protein
MKLLRRPVLSMTICSGKPVEVGVGRVIVWLGLWLKLGETVWLAVCACDPDIDCVWLGVRLGLRVCVGVGEHAVLIAHAAMPR